MKKVKILSLIIALVLLLSSAVPCAFADYCVIMGNVVTSDNIVNIQDATAIQKYLADISILDCYQIEAADVDGDGKVSVKDATTIQKHLAGLYTDSQVEKTIVIPPNSEPYYHIECTCRFTRLLYDVDFLLAFENRDLYTEESFGVFEQVYNTVRNTYESDGHDAMSEAASTLRNAYDALVLKETDPTEVTEIATSPMEEMPEIIPGPVHSDPDTTEITEATKTQATEATVITDPTTTATDPTEMVTDVTTPLETTPVIIPTPPVYSEPSTTETAEITDPTEDTTTVMNGRVSYSIIEAGRIEDYYLSDQTRVFYADTKEKALEAFAQVITSPYSGDYYLKPTLDDSYDDKYFEEKSLIISLNCVGGSNCCQSIDKITVENGVLHLYRSIYQPLCVTCDMNYQFVLIEVSKEATGNITQVENHSTYYTIEDE